MYMEWVGLVALEGISDFSMLYPMSPHPSPLTDHQIQSGRYKTGMCPNLSKPGGCPKGDLCTYAHSEEEREK